MEYENIIRPGLSLNINFVVAMDALGSCKEQNTEYNSYISFPHSWLL